MLKFLGRFLISGISLVFAQLQSAEHSSNYAIMGRDYVRPEKLERFLLQHNPELKANYVRRLVQIYWEETAAEGVRLKVAFAQMCLETGFLKYTNQVKPHQNNFAGFGAIDVESNGEEFPTMRDGIRVQVQHLKAYASTNPTRRRCVDSRRQWVELGSAKIVHQLTNNWSYGDPNYGKKIAKLMDQL